MAKGRILMLEHDGDDRYITEKFFADNSLDIHLDFVTSSEELFEKLDSAVSKKETPNVVLINMRSTPADSPDIIRQIRNSPGYSHIGIVVLSGIKDEKMILECYLAGASSVIIKPDTVKDTDRKILNFARYWFETVEFVKE